VWKGEVNFDICVLEAICMRVNFARTLLFPAEEID
jgi:hypothetical protein